MKLLVLFVIFSSASAVIFECNFEQKAYNIIGSNFSCVVINYGYPNDAPRITEVFGEYQQSRTNKDVIGVSLNFSKIKICYIPSGFEAWFPNFTIFEMFYACITRFNGTELESYANLKSFIFTYSSLEWIPGNFFANNKKLEFIDMSNNKLKFVASNLLNELKSLRYVTFEVNTCISRNGLATKPADIDAFKNLLRSSCSTGELLTTLMTTTVTTTLATSTSTTRLLPTTSPTPMVTSSTTPVIISSLSTSTTKLGSPKPMETQSMSSSPSPPISTFKSGGLIANSTITSTVTPSCNTSPAVPSTSSTTTPKGISPTNVRATVRGAIASSSKPGSLLQSTPAKPSVTTPKLAG